MMKPPVLSFIANVIHPTKQSMGCILFAVLVVVSSPYCFADDVVDPAYLKVVTDRAAKIVDQLDISDADQSIRVRDIIALQYVNLSQIHDQRDQAIQAARAGDPTKEDVDAVVSAARNQADAEIYKLHAAYLAQLSAELTPEQVDGVKDGMTYGVMENTYNVYMKMMPDLSAEQKRQIRAWLWEARELAMDQGSSKEKHGVFGKYKGKINNYVSAAGYNLKEAEKNLQR